MTAIVELEERVWRGPVPAPAADPGRRTGIRRFLAPLERIHGAVVSDPPRPEEVAGLVEREIAAHRRLAPRVNAATRLCRGLASWLPLHDLALVGRFDYEAVAANWYYHVAHYLLSASRPPVAEEDRWAEERLARLRAGLAVRTEPYRQQPCTAATAIARARLALDRFPRARRVLFLGDDDLASVALASLARRRGRAMELVVADLDARLLARIARATAEADLPARTLRADLFRTGLPGEGRFDLAFADPSYEERWVRRFGELAREALVPGGHYCLSIPRPNGLFWLPAWLAEQEARGRLVLAERRVAFNEYPMIALRLAWMGAVARLLVPLDRELLACFCELPYTYSDLWVFERP